jgi:hypothetical protein
MIEVVRTFYGRSVGGHHDKRTIIDERTAYRCTGCGQVWLKKTEAKGHDHNCGEEAHDGGGRTGVRGVPQDGLPGHAR